jgi:hypothetical protein
MFHKLVVFMFVPRFLFIKFFVIIYCAMEGIHKMELELQIPLMEPNLSLDAIISTSIPKCSSSQAFKFCMFSNQLIMAQILFLLIKN